MLTWFRGSETEPPVLLKFRSSKTFIITVVTFAIFTDIFAYGIVVPVFPFALTERAGIDQSEIQSWISIFLAVYGAALLVTAPIFGWLADRTKSRQVPFLAGLIMLGVSTAMLAVGDSIALIAAGRVIQGASAAVVWVIGLALLVDTVGPDDVGSAMGYVGLAMSLAVLLAPLLGGVVLEYAGYYQVYAMAFGLIVLDIIMRFAMIEKKNARKWLPDQSPSAEETLKSEDNCSQSDMEKQAPQEGLATGADDTGRDMSTKLPMQREASPTTSLGPENAPGFLHAVVARLPPVVFLFGSRRVLCALWACVIQSSLMTAFDSILPLFVRKTFHWNSTGAGLVFLPMVVASFAGPFVGRLSDRYGPRLFATAGFVICCPFIILLRLVTHDSIGQKVLLCALLAIIGFGLALVETPITAEIAYAVEAKAQRRPPGFFGKHGAFAQAYGLFNMAWAAGAMIGPLLAGFVVNAKGWPTATLILGCISMFTAVPTAIWTGGSIFKKRRKDKESAKGNVLSAVDSM